MRFNDVPNNTKIKLINPYVRLCAGIVGYKVLVGNKNCFITLDENRFGLVVTANIEVELPLGIYDLKINELFQFENGTIAYKTDEKHFVMITGSRGICSITKNWDVIRYTEKTVKL